MTSCLPSALPAAKAFVRGKASEGQEQLHNAIDMFFDFFYMCLWLSTDVIR